jgi:hypothetical protein
MTRATRASIDTVRDQAQDILARARQDEQFLSDLRSNPNEALLSAGFPQDAAIDFGLEIGAAGEVTGYGGCDRWTCVVSLCGNVPYTNYMN